MNFNPEPIKNWFGFTRRERRSAFIILILIVLIIGVRYTIPESRIDIEYTTSTDTISEFNPETARKFSLSAAQPFSSEHSKSGKSKKHLSIPQRPKIDINTSDSAALVRLPGIGPVLSVRIIKYRRLLGGFATIDQLKEVYGLPEATFDMIKNRIFADSTEVIRININSAGYKELVRFPYFEKYEVSAILKYREIKGRIAGVADLTDNKLITAEKARKVGPYLKYDE